MTPLEIQIKTTADLHGLTLTETSLQRVKEATQQAASKGDVYVQAHSKVTDEMKQQAQAALRTIDANQKAAASVEHLGKNVNSAKTAFSGLKDVLGGAISGNILQVGTGLGKISSAATNASPAMQALFSQIARGASMAAVAAGPLIVLIAAMKQQAAENEKAMQRWWAEAAKSAEAYKQKSAEVKAAAAADLDAMLVKVRELATGYQSLMSDMDRAQSRAKEVTNAQKELALAKANTPEEKAAIEAKFGAAAIENDKLAAGVQQRNAEEAITKARGQLDDAEAGVRDAEMAFQNNPTRANQDAVKAAKANRDKVSAEISPVIKSAQDNIDSARHTSSLADIRKETLAVQSSRPVGSPTTARPTDSSTAPKFDVAGARTRVGEVGSRYDELAGQLKGASDTGEANRIAAEMTKLNTERAVLFKGIGDSIAAERKAAETLRKQMKNTREGGGG